MNKHFTEMTSLFLTTSILLLSACSGGTEGTGATDKVHMSEPQAVSMGIVTALGSVYVNDIHYRTAGGQISNDDEATAESDLEVGQNVTVHGSIDDDGKNGNAERVAISSMIKGPVDGLFDASSNSLGVLGQTIQITDQTRVHDSIAGGLADLTIGDEVKVHGHVLASGIIEATLIKKISAPLHEYRLVGLAQDISGATFNIGKLIIDFSNAHTDGLDGGVPADGQLVKVKGSTELVMGTLLATVVTPVGFSMEDQPHVEVEGYVTAYTSAAEFKIGDVVVTTNDTTRYKDGTAEDIDVGVMLEVTGRIVNGQLQAQWLRFKHNVRIEGTLATNDGALLTVAGLDGISIKVDGNTRLGGSANTGSMGNGVGGSGGGPGTSSDSFTLGDFIRIRGYKTGQHTVNATRIDNHGGGNNKVVLQAPIDSVMAGVSFTLLSITVNTTAATFEFQTDGDDQAPKLGDQVISAAEFYGVAQPGTSVKVRGAVTGGTIAWDSAEIDN